MTPAITAALATFQATIASSPTIAAMTVAQDSAFDIAGDQLLSSIDAEAAVQDALIVPNPVTPDDILGTLGALNNEAAYLDAYGYVGRVTRMVEVDLG